MKKDIKEKETRLRKAPDVHYQSSLLQKLQNSLNDIKDLKVNADEPLHDLIIGRLSKTLGSESLLEATIWGIRQKYIAGTDRSCRKLFVYSLDMTLDKRVKYGLAGTLHSVTIYQLVPGNNSLEILRNAKYLDLKDQEKNLEDVRDELDSKLNSVETDLIRLREEMKKYENEPLVL